MLDRYLKTQMETILYKHFVCFLSFVILKTCQKNKHLIKVIFMQQFVKFGVEWWGGIIAIRTAGSNRIR